MPATYRCCTAVKHSGVHEGQHPDMHVPSFDVHIYIATDMWVTNTVSSPQHGNSRRGDEEPCHTLNTVYERPGMTGKICKGLSMNPAVCADALDKEFLNPWAMNK